MAGASREEEQATMNKSAVTIAVTLTAFTFSGPASASDSEGNFAIAGAGFQPCSAFLESYEAQDVNLLAYRSWINGFVTAHNLLLEDTYNVSPVHTLDELTGVLARVCGANTELVMAQATTAVLNQFEPLHLSAPSEPVTLTQGDASVTVPAVFVERAQTALAELGHYQGGVDGIYGPGTAAAITSFQEAEELPPTGLPDATTLTRLLLR